MSMLLPNVKLSGTLPVYLYVEIYYLIKLLSNIMKTKLSNFELLSLLLKQGNDVRYSR